MNSPNGSPARELWDWEEVERIQRDWADLDRVDEVVEWLRRWITAPPKPVPLGVFWTVVGQQQLSSEFLGGQSWDDQADEIDRQIARQPEPHLRSTADLWEAVHGVEASFEWLNERWRQERAAPYLLGEFLDIYVDLWIDLVESASRIARVPRFS